MEVWEFFGTRLIAGGEGWTPERDNDNRRLMYDWVTPAEFLQWVRRRQERLRRERAADPRLLACPEHRLTWEIALAMERCCRWHYYGER